MVNKIKRKCNVYNYADDNTADYVTIPIMGCILRHVGNKMQEWFDILYEGHS